MDKNMPRPPKTERNKKIVQLKNEGYSFRKLAEIFNVDSRAIFDIYHRDKKKYSAKLASARK